MALSVQKQTETEIAVLQVQYQNIDQKVGDLKTDLKELRDHIDTHMEITNTMIKDFQTDNKKQHDEVNKKVFNKSRVDIRFSDKEGIGVQFDSNEEAEKYVNELVNASTKKFHVIINK